MSQETVNARLEALQATQLLDSPAEPAFDRLTALAAQKLDAPVSVITLIDKDRQYFKSTFGMGPPLCEVRQNPLSHSFCQHVVAVGEKLLVRDAREHPLVQTNPAVKEMGVIAYAGVPLTDSRNRSFGSLCVFDFKPRDWSNGDISVLKTLAAQVMTEIETRHKERSLDRYLASVQARDAAPAAPVIPSSPAVPRRTIQDLRTPLSSLLLSLEALEKLNLSPEQLEWLALSRNSAVALKELVNTLADGESAPPPPIEQTLILGEFSFRSLVEAALDQIKGSASARKQAITHDFEADLPKIRVDDRKIVRVLVNLLSNAVKLTHDGGTIRCSLRRLPRNRIAFAVTDAGKGFNPKDAVQVFNQGMTIDPTARSAVLTGWGLEFCKRVAEAHGGTLEAMSAPGASSTFTLSLPIAP